MPKTEEPNIAIWPKSAIAPPHGQPEQFDAVRWQGKEGLETGVIREIWGKFADIMTGHRDTTVERERLQIVFDSRQWNPDALRNHLRAIYGLEFPFSLTCQSCYPGSNIASKEQAEAEGRSSSLEILNFIGNKSAASFG